MVPAKPSSWNSNCKRRSKDEFGGGRKVRFLPGKGDRQCLNLDCGALGLVFSDIFVFKLFIPMRKMLAKLFLRLLLTQKCNGLTQNINDH
jgi:hypothetical protein